MILDEYDEQFHIASEKKLSYAQGHSDGLKEGLQQAQDVIQATKEQAQFFKKIIILHLKNQSDEAIAQELNVSMDTVHKILNEAELDITL